MCSRLHRSRSGVQSDPQKISPFIAGYSSGQLSKDDACMEGAGCIVPSTAEPQANTDEVSAIQGAQALNASLVDGVVAILLRQV